jgi:hypothetical protein
MQAVTTIGLDIAKHGWGGFSAFVTSPQVVSRPTASQGLYRCRIRTHLNFVIGVHCTPFAKVHRNCQSRRPPELPSTKAGHSYRSQTQRLDSSRRPRFST